jgi:tetratricopeptide (TPR) repeat protein
VSNVGTLESEPADHARRTIWSGILSIILGYDPATLRERVDLLAAGDRLAELGELRSLSALNEKVSLLRLTGRLDEALDIANEALRQARFTGDREEVLAARIRRAQVLQYQDKYDEAHIELSSCVEAARSNDWIGLEAFAVQCRGKVLFDQHDYSAALGDFTSAVFLREKLGASQGEIESALAAVAVVRGFLEDPGADVTGPETARPEGSDDDS